MKIRKYIVWIVVIGAAVFYGLPVTLLQIPYFQQKVVQTAAGYLEDRIGTNIEIRQVDFRPFNRLILKDVYLEDRQGDTLLYAKRVAAGFEFLPLFQKRFRFGSVQFHSFVLHLSRPAPDAPLNIQYLIDAFRNENAPKGNIDLHINDLSLRKGRVSYRVKTATTTSGRFHPSDLDWRDITGKIRVKHCTNDSLSVVVQRLSAVEQSGLDIRQLAFDLSAGSQKANIRQLTLKLPQSALYLTQIAVNYRRFPPGEHWADSLQFSLHIEPSQIRPEDINALSPVFRRFDRLLEMQGLVAGSLDTLRLTDFLISSDNQFRLAFDATALHLNADDRSRIYMNSRILDSYITVEGIQALANSFSPKPTPLPEPALRLGAVSLQGEVEGLLNQLKATVRLQTEVGNLQADVRFGKDHFPFLAGKLATTGIDVKKLLANDDWGTARFEVNLNTALVNGKDWEGTVEALVGELDYKAYRYENIGFSGDFTANSFKGSLTADSPAGRLAANGSFTLKGKDSQFNFSAEATNLLLDQLHWTKKYRNPKLSFQVDAGFTGDRPDNLAGSLSFRNLVFSNSAGVYSMDTLFVRATDDENQKRLEIRSNLLTGTVDGRFSLPAIAGALEQMASAYLPSLLPAVSSPVVENTDFYWSFTINDTQDLSTVLDLPLTIYEPSQITGEYNYRQNRFRLDGVFPLFKCGALVIENSTVGLTNENDAVELKFDGTQLKRKGVNLLLSARIKALNDSIASSIRWNGDNDSKNRGELDFTTQLSYQEGKYPLSASVRIQPSEMIFNDSIWTLSPTAIDYREGRLRIDGFEARHHRQKINMEGIASGNASDQLRVSLQAVDLDYIFQLLNLPALTFGGIA
ncbi:MAG: AsmA family protein, partial [Dysgonamonadaceae bacterium]|nr:AsmA family protein [Dysgonamonadaceae bacterium]